MTVSLRLSHVLGSTTTFRVLETHFNTFYCGSWWSRHAHGIPTTYPRHAQMRLTEGSRKAFLTKANPRRLR